MRDLKMFFRNPFDDPGISIAELLAFSTDNHQRMVANNPAGELTDRIMGTAGAIALVQTNFGSDLTKGGQRKSSKQFKKDFRDALPATMAKLCGVVVGKYGEKSPQFGECCPQGRTVFTKSTDDALNGHLQVFIDGVTAHQGDLGAQVVTDATAVQSAWLAVYTTSEAATGGKTATESAKKASRENLQLMLYLNLVKLMEMFARQPEKLPFYMTQSLLEDHPHHPDAPGTSPAPAPPSP